MTYWFITGPMSGLPEHNYPMFRQAEMDLRMRDLREPPTVWNPVNAYGGTGLAGRAQYMEANLAKLEGVTDLLILPGWEKSLGSCTEILAARQIEARLWFYTPNSPPYKGLISPVVWAETCRKAAQFLADTYGEDHRDLVKADDTDILARAAAIVNGDRQSAYGPPEDNFRRIADFWSTYLEVPVSAIDVAHMNILQKVAREMHSENLDSLVDIAGYAACAERLYRRHEEEEE